MHNYTASLGPRLSELSGFELVKLMLGFSMLGYKPTWSFLNQVAQAVEVRLCVWGGGYKWVSPALGCSFHICFGCKAFGVWGNNGLNWSS
jgi:hypothetical protein